MVTNFQRQPWKRFTESPPSLVLNDDVLFVNEAADKKKIVDQSESDAKEEASESIFVKEAITVERKELIYQSQSDIVPWLRSSDVKEKAQEGPPLLDNLKSSNVVIKKNSLKELQEKFNLTLLPVQIAPGANLTVMTIIFPPKETQEVEAAAVGETVKVEKIVEIENIDELERPVAEETLKVEKIEPVAGFNSAPVLLDTMESRTALEVENPVVEDPTQKLESTKNDADAEMIEEIENEEDDNDDDFFVGNIDDKAPAAEIIRNTAPNGQMTTGISIKGLFYRNPLSILKTHPIRSHEKYKQDIHGSLLYPSIFTVIPAYTNNLVFLIKIGPSGYWFRPRIYSSFIKSEDPEFPFYMRLECCSLRQKKCNTKLSVFFKSTDIFADDFMRVENFKAGKLEKFDPYATLMEMETAPKDGTHHLQVCVDPDAWKIAAKRYTNARMKENRASTKLKQREVREEIIKNCEISDEFEKELFSITMNKKFSTISKRFADKIEVRLISNHHKTQLNSGKFGLQ